MNLIPRDENKFYFKRDLSLIEWTRSKRERVPLTTSPYYTKKSKLSTLQEHFYQCEQGVRAISDDPTTKNE